MAAAYLRMLGMTQEESAKSVGISRRTMQRWESHPTWPAAMEEARDTWMADMDYASRARILKAIREEKDTQSAWWFLERTDRRFQARQGKGGLHMNVIVGAKLGLTRE